MTRKMIHRVGIVLTQLLLLSIYPISSILASPAGSPVDLTDVFQADGILDRVLNSTLEELEVAGPDPVPDGNITFVEKTITGIRFAGFPIGTDSTDPSKLELKEGRITVQMWFPNSIDFSNLDTSWLVIQQGSSPDSQRDLKKILSRKFARSGVPAAMWYQEDLHPIDPENPVDSVAVQLGYPNQNVLLEEGISWMAAIDPDLTPLTVRDLRYHFRFGIAQGYMLTTTFAQRFLADHFGSQATDWADSMKSFLAGGSKGGTSSLTVCGVDPRVRAARISGSQSFNSGPLGAWARYRKDWGECPGGQYAGRADFTFWAEEHEADTPSYYDVYVPERCPERYSSIFFLDIVGTHDYINPLGSHSAFWQRHDGLVNGVPDPSEEAWDFCILRRPNQNHGAGYVIGQVNNFEISASLVLFFRAVRHIALGRGLARLKMVEIDTTGSQSWSAKVRVSGAHDPQDEQYQIFVALSDDRDFRRCTPPTNTPLGPCFEGVGDDNKEEEDKFIAVPATSVSINGEERIVSFTPPSELAAFGPTPLIAIFVEMKLEGSNPNRFGDDTWLHTEVAFANDELYAEQTCP